MLTITIDTARRFILGKQGLWTGGDHLRDQAVSCKLSSRYDRYHRCVHMCCSSASGAHPNRI
jgi:hypothetical protein